MWRTGLGLKAWAFPVEGPGVSRVLSVPYMKHGAPTLAVVAMLMKWPVLVIY